MSEPLRGVQYLEEASYSGKVWVVYIAKVPSVNWQETIDITVVISSYK